MKLGDTSTRCHQFAMLVVYESALAVICDSPFNYKNQPGTDFLKLVPTTRSEIRYIEGYPGEDIQLGRRIGDQWFVGGMTGEQSREVTFLLDFLADGTFTATLWKDAVDSGLYPAHLSKESLEVHAGESFSIKMERGGGFVMILDPH